MKTVEKNNGNARKTPAELRDFKKVGNGSIPGEKRIDIERKQPVKNPQVGVSKKLEL